jgi:hypothetical protein
LNAAMQIGYALALLLDTPQGDNEAVSQLTIKDVFAVCREKYCSMTGAPIRHLVDENMHKERAMLAQADTKTQVQLVDCNGKPGESDGSDAQVRRSLRLHRKTLRSSRSNCIKLRRICPVNNLLPSQGIKTETFTTDSTTEGIQDASDR